MDVSALMKLVSPFSWLAGLGKGDADHVKSEIADLLQHSSQSLRSLIELDQVLVEVPPQDFKARFWPIANHCYYQFTSPEGAQRARTHCTDIQRDVARINFRMAQVLRAEHLDWKGIGQAFADLVDADRDYLSKYEAELVRLGTELRAIEQLVGKDDPAAWTRYEDLRQSVRKSRSELSDQISLMQKAQTNVHRLLT